MRLRGFSLVELMLGLFAGTIVIAAGTQLFYNASAANTRSLQLNTLNQDLRAMLDVMVSDLRRAGYVSANPDSNADGLLDASIKENPFAELAVEDDGHCIVYMINKNSNNPPVETSERLGFKLDSDKSVKPPKGILRSRRSSPALTCASGYWENFTSPAVEITDLRFVLSNTPLNISAFKSNPTVILQQCTSGSACLYRRRVDINLSGRLLAQPDIELTVQDSVAVRNDRLSAHVP